MMLHRFLFTCFLTFGLLLALVPETSAQVNPKVMYWAFGKVYLTSGDTVAGSMSYYRDEEIIKVEQPGKATYTFSPVNLTGFVVKDDNLLTYREYRTLLWNSNNLPNGYLRPAIFEHLQDGTYSLLKRDTYILINNQEAKAAGRLAATLLTGMPLGLPIANQSYQLLEVFYILTPDGKIIQLKNPKKDLPVLFGRKAQQMNDFIKENNLSYSKVHDLKAIMQYYNSLL